MAEQLPDQRSGRGRGQGRGRGATLRAISGRPPYDDSHQHDRMSNDWNVLCERHKRLLAKVPLHVKRPVSDEVYDAVYNKDITRIAKLLEYSRTRELNRANHVEVMDLLLQVETVHQDVEMRKYDKEYIYGSCSAIVPGLANGQPSLAPGDLAVVYDSDQFENTTILNIKTIKKDTVYFFARQCVDIRVKSMKIAFYSSGTQLDICRSALFKSTSKEISKIIWDEEEMGFQGKFSYKLWWSQEDISRGMSEYTNHAELETLFSLPDSNRLLRKIYFVNPELQPDFRGKSPDYSYDKDFFAIKQGQNKPEDGDWALIQSPESFETVLLPMKDGCSHIQIVEEKRREILKFLSEPNLDFMFVHGSLVEESGLAEKYVLNVQRSLREIFHGSREEVDSMLYHKEVKIEVDHEYDDVPELEQRLNKLNEPQRQAVVAILEARYRPKPYILFGPPGTGKTHTLVEAAVQIHKRDSRAKILFCANSNTCADQIYDKLKATGMFGLNSLERIKAGDSVSGKSFNDVIVTTNMKSGGFMNQTMDKRFDYVFLDEAGHAHEPESLVPISSLKTTTRLPFEKVGLLVLAGDPKQLGPVVMNQAASDFGLGKSLLERVFDFSAYDKHDPYGRYNKYYITKLLYCYRCDPSILEISNKLFYDDELIYVNKTPASLLTMLNLKKSVQFHHVGGNEDQPKWSTSWRNYGERLKCVDIVLRLYEMGLEASQIGVITPYKLQAKDIERALEGSLISEASFLPERFPSKQKATDADDLINGLANLDLNINKPKRKFDTKEYMCKIDTVDAFQGNEREVIIISTVRTDLGKRLDFLNDARRFNVAVSRAKWLVITLGHRDVLSQGRYWPEFLKNAETDISGWPARKANRDPFKLTAKLFK